ncbi:phosducin-like protein 3 [Paramacrobiotus metropolitanus]|uniref:phosducin-like protein 3 n=1 Tax=Paramacrobiotus metropolitanus TaxID=2943436 RepID=UPI0024461186|nr:phosducin-like protein 3 [Paramacrobiotus metropolitanus]
MQDPYADTEWNDALRKAGILPEKPPIRTQETESEPVSLTLTKDGTKDYATMTLDELDDFEDDDPEFFEEFKKKRMAEWKESLIKKRFGEVLEISGVDYVKEINNAGEGIWVVLHLYKQGFPLCALINRHISALAPKFPDVKFVKSIATTCVPNFPDASLPAIFIYFEGDLKRQIVGQLEFGGLNLTEQGLEWILAQEGVLKTELTSDPRLTANNRSRITTVRGQNRADDSDDE